MILQIASKCVSFCRSRALSRTAPIHGSQEEFGEPHSLRVDTGTEAHRALGRVSLSKAGLGPLPRAMDTPEGLRFCFLLLCLSLPLFLSISLHLSVSLCLFSVFTSLIIFIFFFFISFLSLFWRVEGVSSFPILVLP